MTSDQIHTQKPEDVDVPIADEHLTKEWGSDYLAEVIRDLDLRYIALNPGASFRGLHDSLVNFLGNRNPQMPAPQIQALPLLLIPPLLTSS